MVITLKEENGLHARPAGQFVKTISPFKSQVELEFEGKKINARSIMSIMGLGLKQGSSFKVIAQGEDCGETIKAIGEFFGNTLH